MIRRAPAPPIGLRPLAGRAVAVVVATLGVGAAGPGCDGCAGRGPPPTAEPPPQSGSVVEAAAPPTPDDAPRTLP
jgi:hypothetical protein